jgi:DNA-binding response OmpR family regulator
MEPEKIRNLLKGKMVLIVDDEKDVLNTLADLLEICKVDEASTFEEAKDLLEKNRYDVAILDIMGVKGYELLEIAKENNIPSLMLTAHSLSERDLKKSAELGASYYAPKEEINKIQLFVADVLETKERNESPWVRVFKRLTGYYDKQFGGTDWREKERSFWENKFRRFHWG